MNSRSHSPTPLLLLSLLLVLALAPAAPAQIDPKLVTPFVSTALPLDSTTDTPVADVVEPGVEAMWDDLKDAPATVKEQLPYAGDQVSTWLVRTTVKSGTKFNNAPNMGVLRTGEHYATDFTTHATVGEAMRHAMQPQSVGTAVKGSVKGTTHPLALAGHVIAPIAVEGVRQIKEDHSIDVRKLAGALDPLPIAGGVAGVIAGDAAGAVVQSTLGAVGGPVGQVAGMFVRPMMSWAGYMIGNNAGRSAKDGHFSMRTAFADTLRQTNPAQMACTVVGSTLGGMVGQALIPIPVVGYIVGSVVGGVVGSAVGNVIGKHGPLAVLNKALIGWMHRKADDLERKEGAERSAPVDLNADGSIVTVPEPVADDVVANGGGDPFFEPLEMLDQKTSSD